MTKNLIIGFILLVFTSSSFPKIGYDVTFEGLRLGGGVLFGWEKFRLKLGGGYFDPEGRDHFTLLVIGLWWRFMG